MIAFDVAVGPRSTRPKTAAELHMTTSEHQARDGTTPCDRAFARPGHASSQYRASPHPEQTQSRGSEICICRPQPQQKRRRRRARSRTRGQRSMTFDLRKTNFWVV